MFTRIPLKGAIEYDILTNARNYYCYTDKPGICKWVKRKYNKRFRKKTKQELRGLTYDTKDYYV